MLQVHLSLLHWATRFIVQLLSYLSDPLSEIIVCCRMWCYIPAAGTVKPQSKQTENTTKGFTVFLFSGIAKSSTAWSRCWWVLVGTVTAVWSFLTQKHCHLTHADREWKLEKQNIQEILDLCCSPFFDWTLGFRATFISRWPVPGRTVCSSWPGYFQSWGVSAVCSCNRVFRAQTINAAVRSIGPLLMFTSEARGCKPTGIKPILWRVV